MLTEAEILTKCSQFLDDALNNTILDDRKKRAWENQDFFRGGKSSWDAIEYETFKARGVTPVSINRCKPVIKAVLGMYLQAKQEIRVLPRRGGSSTVAQIHSELIKHTQDISNSDYEYVRLLMRGSIDTEAYLRLRIDKSENANGQPKIDVRNIVDVRVDPNASEYDLNSSARYVIDRVWRDKEEINILYPDKDDLIKAAIAEIDKDANSPARRLAIEMFSGQGSGDDFDENDYYTSRELMERYRYLVHHIYWKEFIPAVIVTQKSTGQSIILENPVAIKRALKKESKSENYIVYRFCKKILHETIMLGKALLEDIVEPIGEGVTDFPIVRYAPMWDDGYSIGLLDDIISLNQEENIFRTQAIRNLNQTANSGFIVEKCKNEEAKRVLEEYGSVPGVVLERDNYNGRIERLQPNQLSTGHFALSQQFEQDVKRVSGIDDATQGYYNTKAESGRAIGLQQASNRSSNQIFFDNLYWTFTIFGNTLLRSQMAFDFYTDDEIQKVISESTLLDAQYLLKAKQILRGKIYGADLPQPHGLPTIDPSSIRPEDRVDVMRKVQAGMESAQAYQKAYPLLQTNWDSVIKVEAIKMLLQELRADKGLYGVKIIVSPSSPTERITQFLQLDSLAKNYPNIIPPDVYVDATDIAAKDEIKERIVENQQRLAVAQSQGGQVMAGVQR